MWITVLYNRTGWLPSVFPTPKELNINTLRLKLKMIYTFNSFGVGRRLAVNRRFHLRLFTFNPFGILGKLYFTNSLNWVLSCTQPKTQNLNSPQYKAPFLSFREFVNRNLPKIPKGLNMNNRPVQQDGLTAKHVPNYRSWMWQSLLSLTIKCWYSTPSELGSRFPFSVPLHGTVIHIQRLRRCTRGKLYFTNFLIIFF